MRYVMTFRKGMRMFLRLSKTFPTVVVAQDIDHRVIFLTPASHPLDKLEDKRAFKPR